MSPSRRFLVLSCAVFTLAFVSAEPGFAGIRAGAARRSIVPPFPCPLGGFMDRTQPFEGVHDEIYARALALDNGQTQVIIIGSDLTALDADLTRKVRERVEQETGVPAAHVMVSCAHNHSAPSFWEPSRLREAVPKAKEFFVTQFAEAAIEAYNSRTDALIGFATGAIHGMTTNRQQKNDFVDPQVGVLRAENKKTGETIAVLFNFTGHPVVLGSSNLLISGEYPGAAARAIEELLGGVAIFTQGACGDVTVRRSGDPFREIERIGRTLAGEVIKTVGFIHGSDDLPLAAVSRTVQLQPRQIPSTQEAEAAIQNLRQAIAEAKAKGSNDRIIGALEQKLQLQSVNLRFAKSIEDGTYMPPESIDAEVQVIRVGDLILVGIPGEIFVEYALEMRDRVRQTYDKSLCLVGYCNGYIGYIVTPRARETGGYEASVARVAADSGRVLTETAINLLPEIAQ